MVTVDLRTRTPQQFASMVVGKLAALAIVGLSHHVFTSLASGDVWETRLDGAGTAPPETWLEKLGVGATCVAGYPSADGSQHLFVTGTDGPVRPLKIAPPTYQWRWGNPITRQHNHIIGLAAYYVAVELAADTRDPATRLEWIMSRNERFSDTRPDGPRS